MSESDDDRRRHQRISAELIVKLGHGDATHDGTTRDVSEGGLGLVIEQRLERGEKVAIEVLLEGPKATDPASIKTMATVMWSAETDTGAFTAGLAFDGPSSEAIDRLRRFLATRSRRG